MPVVAKLALLAGVDVREASGSGLQVKCCSLAWVTQVPALLHIRNFADMYCKYRCTICVLVLFAC